MAKTWQSLTRLNCTMVVLCAGLEHLRAQTLCSGLGDSDCHGLLDLVRLVASLELLYPVAHSLVVRSHPSRIFTKETALLGGLTLLVARKCKQTGWVL